MSNWWQAITQIDLTAVAFQFEWKAILAYGIGLLLLYFIARLLYVPMRLTFPLLVNGLIGILFLLVFNFIGDFFGLRLAINPITALVVGFLGVPGVGLLIALQLWLGVS